MTHLLRSLCLFISLALATASTARSQEEKAPQPEAGAPSERKSLTDEQQAAFLARRTGGRGYVIVSVIEKKNEERVFPDVRSMVKSFRLKSSREAKKPEDARGK